MIEIEKKNVIKERSIPFLIFNLVEQIRSGRVNPWGSEPIKNGYMLFTTLIFVYRLDMVEKVYSQPCILSLP